MRILIKLFFLISSTLIYAQEGSLEYLQNFDKQSFHWGYYIGYNQLQFETSMLDSDDPYTYGGDQSNGFNIGLVASFQLQENISFRLEPGLLISGKKDVTEGDQGTKQTLASWNSTYLHLPFLIKLSTNRWGNIRPYIIGGVSYDFNFKNPESIENMPENLSLNRNQFMSEFGLGIDFYLHYFKFSPSIRGVYSLTDEAFGIGNYGLEKLRTRGLYLNLTFE